MKYLLKFVIALLVCTPAMAQDSGCCSCAITPTQSLVFSEDLPCTFDHPLGWDSKIADDGATVSAVAGPLSCEGTCPNGSPGISLSIGTKPDPNAETLETVWRQAMQIVGDARCGDGTVTFFSLPGADPLGTIGGMNFYVSSGGKKYKSGATFTCGAPGEWMQLRKLFIESFRDNPGSNFGGN